MFLLLLLCTLDTGSASQPTRSISSHSAATNVIAVCRRIFIAVPFCELELLILGQRPQRIRRRVRAQGGLAQLPVKSEA